MGHFAMGAGGKSWRGLGVAMALFSILAATPGHTAIKPTAYTYDALGRLTGASGPFGAVTYAYDPAGNRTQQTVTPDTPTATAGAVTATWVNAPPIVVLELGCIDPTVALASDPGGLTLTASVAVQPTHVQGGATSWVFPNGGNSLCYANGNPGYWTDHFTYKVANQTLNNSATAVITVTAIGTPPIAKPQTLAVHWSGYFGKELGCIDLANASQAPGDSDPDGDTLSVSGYTQGAHTGSIVLQSGTSLCYWGSGPAAWTDSFNFTLSDPHGSASSSVAVNVLNP